MKFAPSLKPSIQNRTPTVTRSLSLPVLTRCLSAYTGFFVAVAVLLGIAASADERIGKRRAFEGKKLKRFRLWQPNLQTLKTGTGSSRARRIRQCPLQH